MKLVIRRNQADMKGIFGGHKGVRFSLFGRVHVTDAERALIERYKVGDYALADYNLRLGDKMMEFRVSVNDIGMASPWRRTASTLCLNSKTKSNRAALR